jgi:UDPglucose 6-dehydrogenase
MQICVIGTGYVGLVAGACFADMGHVVTCVDNNVAKVEQLTRGVIGIHEPGLPEMVSRNVARGRLRFVSELARVTHAQVYFITVGTPSNADGSSDISQVMNVARQIGRLLVRRAVVVVRSTVPVGITESVESTILVELRQRELKLPVDMAFNPEFLREGAAIEDFMHPDRVVIGSRHARAISLLRDLYAPLVTAPEQLLLMRVRDAEFAKQAANAMLATRISFINEMAGLCEKLGVDAESVRVGICSDSRIGYSFMQPGCGFGGSCLPKDTRALIRIAYEVGYEPSLLAAVDLRNRRQKAVLFEKIRRRFGASLRNVRFAVWGLAFKPGTDDMREAPSLPLLHALIDAGATVRANDPEAMPNAQRLLPPAWFESGQFAFDSQYQAAEGADALVLVTEWRQYRQPDFAQLKRAMRQWVLFDGRNQYDPLALHNEGFEYFGIGRATPPIARIAPRLKLAASSG